MQRLDITTWKTIFSNLKENNEAVEILYLDGTKEYVLCFNTELFEDGFQTENEAIQRLEHIESMI